MAWDFRCPGVTSISCDIHKYGGCVKGCSVIAYSTHELRQFQYFTWPDWTGGLAFSKGFQGSRNGAASAVAWYTMMCKGSEGYAEMAKTHAVRFRFMLGRLKSIKGLTIFGEPSVVMIAFNID